jgi:class 3 adenylate cyclase
MNLFSEYKLLLISKNIKIFDLLQSAFKAEIQMYSIFHESSGNKGIQTAKTQKPDLIIIDISVDNNHGISILKKIKEGETTFDIPVIMITEHADLEKSFEAGAVDFIRKPPDKSELTIRIKSTLSIFKLIKGIVKQTEELEIQQDHLEKQKQEIEIEKQKSDELLLNILPYEIAEQLKNKGMVDAKTYRLTSILFTDFKDFTHISAELSPEELIEELGIYFQKFDEITSRHFIEKIKTIGDSYMCVGGLPLRNKSNPFDTVLAALEIQKFVKEYNQEKKEKKLPEWKLRIGIHTGKVIAGVIGSKKFAYDIWGDAVNTASRMESSGEAGEVNISGETYEYIKDYFECSHRGKIPAKNKGEIDMYFVHGLIPKFRKNFDPITPSTEFLEILSSY